VIIYRHRGDAWYEQVLFGFRRAEIFFLMLSENITRGFCMTIQFALATRNDIFPANESSCLRDAG
jgi:hypothetical protein